MPSRRAPSLPGSWRPTATSSRCRWTSSPATTSSTASARRAGIEFSADESYFWVSNALESTISSFGFGGDGAITLIDQAEVSGVAPTDDDPFGTTDGWIDLWISSDGKYLYQLFGLDGTIGVFEINGSSLTLIQEVTGNLPAINTQGIVAI